MKHKNLILPVMLFSIFFLTYCGGSETTEESEGSEMIEGQEATEYEYYSEAMKELDCYNADTPIEYDLNNDGVAENIFPIVKDNDTGNCIYAIFKQQNGEWERIEGSEFEVGSFGFALGQTKTKGWFDIVVTLTENGNNIGKTYKWNGKKYTLAETKPSDEGEMTTNADMILGRWASQTAKGFEVEFKDGQRIEFQDGVEGGWMPYSVVESCDNQTDDAMGSALSVKYDCYTLEFTSSNEFIVQQQSPKKGKKEVYKRK